MSQQGAANNGAGVAFSKKNHACLLHQSWKNTDNGANAARSIQKHLNKQGSCHFTSYFRTESKNETSQSNYWLPWKWIYPDLVISDVEHHPVLLLAVMNTKLLHDTNK